MVLGIPIRELKDRINGRDFFLYQCYNEINPFGYERADFNAASIQSTQAYVHGVRIPPCDFMPKFESSPEDEEQREQRRIRDLTAKLTQFASCHNKSVNG